MLKKGKWQWTVKDVQDLLRLHAQNVPDADAAKVLGCKNDVFLVKAKQMNLVFRSKHFWIKKRVAQLHGLLMEGYSRTQIAREMGITKEQLLAQLMVPESLPLAARAVVFALSHFDREASLREISEASGYSAALVQKVLVKTGAGNQRCACAYSSQRIAKMRLFMKNGLIDEENADAPV